MKQNFTSARRPLEILIHIIGWGIMFGFPFFFVERENGNINWMAYFCHLYTSPSPRDSTSSRMPSSA